MGKHRKTREQKIIADLRKKLETTTQPEFHVTSEKQTIVKSFFVKNIEKTQPATSTGTLTRSIYTHQFLLQDLRKTAITTCFLAIAELLLLFLMRR